MIRELDDVIFVPNRINSNDIIRLLPKTTNRYNKFSEDPKLGAKANVLGF